MSKFRQYSIVIHNVENEKSQAKIKEYAQKNAKEYVMSVEPYPQGNGFHLHLYVQYQNQRGFKSVLKEIEKLSKDFITPKPPGEDRSWGRVQLDVMRGRFSQATAYLQGETKDKPTGEVLSGELKPCRRRIRKTGTTYEEVCGICWSNLCMGCCQGCIICDENHEWFDSEIFENYKKSQDAHKKKYLYKVSTDKNGSL